MTAIKRNTTITWRTPTLYFTNIVTKEIAWVAAAGSHLGPSRWLDCHIQKPVKNKSRNERVF